MTQVGYGVQLKDGTIKGLWPVPLDEARKMAKRYRGRGFADAEVVTVHAGSRVPLEDTVIGKDARTA